MEGCVLSFLKAEWKVSDTGSAHWVSSLFFKIISVLISFTGPKIVLLIFCLVNKSILIRGSHGRDRMVVFYNYLWNLCLSSLMLRVRISIRARCTTLCDKVCQWLVRARWFSSGPLVSSTNKTDCHNITELLLEVALNTIKQTYIMIMR
jgi:hypothetical protein